MSSKLRDQLEQGNISKITERDFIRKAKDRKYYGYTFDQAGRHPISLAIDFMLKDGSRFGVFYIEIQSPVQLDLGNGNSGQKILLNTASIEIFIEGKNLNAVYEYIIEQRLVWIKENDQSFPMNDDIEIDSISINT
ncbi:MAG: hypothetical protein AAFP92_05200 [Bacteroidota bacterium]